MPFASFGFAIRTCMLLDILLRNRQLSVAHPTGLDPIRMLCPVQQFECQRWVAKSQSPWRDVVARHLVRPITAEWPLLTVQRSDALKGDEWQVSAAAVIGTQKPDRLRSALTCPPRIDGQVRSDSCQPGRPRGSCLKREFQKSCPSTLASLRPSVSGIGHC